MHKIHRKLLLIPILASLVVAILGFSTLQAQGETSGQEKVASAIAAGEKDQALALLTDLIGRDPKNLMLLRVRLNLLLSMKRRLEAMEHAQRMAGFLRAGLEKASLLSFASLSLSLYDKLETADILERLAILRERRSLAQMAPLVQTLARRIVKKAETPRLIVAEFYGSENRFFDQERALTHLKLYLAATDKKELRSLPAVKKERLQAYRHILALENDEKLHEIIPRPIVDEHRTLFDEAILHRAARDVGKLLQTLRELEKLRPKDPTIQLGLAEVYGSAGPQFSLSRARTRLRRFLKRTTADALRDAGWKPIYAQDDLATSIRRLSGTAHGRDLEQIRQTARGYLDLLERKGRLLLLTPPTVMTSLQSKIRRNMKKRRTEISEAETKISRYEDKISEIKSSRTRNTTLKKHKGSAIASMEEQIRRYSKRIEELQQQLEQLDTELQRLQQASR
jgi:predicted Zn-dependent protease